MNINENEASCAMCNRNDTQEMVMCDRCAKWHHFVCVNVTRAVEDVHWVCPACLKANQRPIVQAISQIGSKNNRTGSSVSKKSSRRSIELQLLEEEQELAQTQADARERRAQEREKRAEEREKRAEEREKMERDFMAMRKSIILENAASEQQSVASSAIRDRTNEWVASHASVVESLSASQRGQIDETIVDDNKRRPIHQAHSFDSWHSLGQSSKLPDNQSLKSKKSEQQIFENLSVARQFRPHDRNNSVQDPPKANPPNTAFANMVLQSEPNYHRSYQDCNNKPPVRAATQQFKPAALEAEVITLSQSQSAARQVLGRDLPTFSGRPEEWAIFISSYENTTQICGFSNSENLIRLQRCLKGKALEAVGRRLILPASVPSVIETLRLLFGRSELILQDLLTKVRQEISPQDDNLESIIQYSLSVQNLVGVMEDSKMMQHLQNPLLLQELVGKLPPQLKLQWALHMQFAISSNLSTFCAWLTNIAIAVSAVTTPSCETQSTEKRTSNKAGGQVNAHSVLDIKEELKLLTREERWDFVNKKQLCFACFGKHSKRFCKNKTECGQNGCILTHHPLLHNFDKPPITKKRSDHFNSIASVEKEKSETLIPNEKSKEKVSSGSIDTPNDNVSTCHAHQKQSSTGTLFRIVPVTLFNKNKKVETYAFLDEGSSLTMINDSIARELDLQGTPQSLCLRWTGDHVREESDSQIVSFYIAGTSINNKKYLLKDVRTVNTLSLPRQSVSVAELKKKFPYLFDTNLQDYQDSVPTVLIGVDNGKLCLPSETRQGKWGEPIAMNTRLGWTIHGNCNQINRDKFGENNVHHSFHVCRCMLENDLHTMVEKFFSIENFGVQNPNKLLESEEDIHARKLLVETTERVNDRFRTGLLWKPGEIELPDSLPMAKQRLRCLIRKMESNPILAENLREQIVAYVDKGYARKLTQAELKMSFPRTWYLPVFVVINPNKPGKVRMVWDAAAKVNGISLNSTLLKGPDQLSSLPQILYGFRQGKIAVGGDIKEMFHQVQIHSADQHAQRFLWPSDQNQRESDVYVMQVMTFGASCSPSSAHYVKNRNATEHAEQYPRAAKSIIDHHYVDDMLDSVDTVEEAIKLATEVRIIHKQGGFEIRNWMSNSDLVLDALDEPKKHMTKDMNISTEAELTKVLGMWWRCDQDVFTYSTKNGKIKGMISHFHNRKPSKREVLRMLMMIYDPLGFLSAFLIYLKILMQDIWRSGIGWDETISDEHNERWLRWMHMLPEIENIQIPRCYTFNQSKDDVIVSTQLHIFVDASENAFAAVAYFRFETVSRFTCTIVGSKTKVAPKIPTSIPRLELLAATLGARLANDICNRHSIRIDKRVFWSDSKTVLCWLKTDPRKFRQFVAFRVGEILELSNVNEWRWVSTKSNVADEATKWQTNPNLSSNSRWFTGPEFLIKNESEWTEDTIIETTTVSDELRVHLAHNEIIEPCTVNHLRFSSWRRLCHAQACLARTAKNISCIARHKPTNREPRTAAEHLQAKIMLYQRAQYDAYLPEIVSLQSGQTHVNKQSAIFRLSPYLDEQGTLRLRGRIDAVAKMSGNVKRPIILPRDHHITELIATSFHVKYHHLQHETALNELRQMFVIFQDRRLMKTIRSSCMKCKISRAAPQAPEMAPLPPSRLAAFTRPFSHVGVDCFGPLTIAIGRRTEKRWGMLFTCLTVRAVHLEVAHSLSRESCIICLRNFIARRGQPITITSDNGTNFHGADNELHRAFLSIQDEYAPIEIRWIFNPPASPHMGGSWERLVGSIKRVLCEIMPTTRLPTDEIFQAALIEAESIVNSRPLTFVPLPNNDSEALTPNHFLLGSSNGIKPPGVFNKDDLISRSSWRKTQYIANEFWKRWVKEYLPTITRRTKWFQPTKNISIGDVVIITDENLPRNTWPKGIVQSVTIGKDNIVRRAIVKTQFGVMERPVVKLAIIDVNNNTRANQDLGTSPKRT